MANATVADKVSPILRRYLRFEGAAEYVGVGLETFRKMVRDGRVRPYRVSPRRPVFDIRELDKLVLASPR